MPSHRHLDYSGEIDVFEATRYFSGFSDAVRVSPDPKVKAEEVVTNHPPTGGIDQGGEQRQRTARTSLDVPLSRAGRSRALSKEKSPRTPSSPGGKIVSFLNSLFNQSASSEGGKERKVKKSKASGLAKDRERISHGGWQRRGRSSTSRVPTQSTLAESKSLPAPVDGNSGSRMLRAWSITDAPRNDTRILSDHRQAAISVSIGNRAREEFAKWKVSCMAEEGKDPGTIAAAVAASDPCEYEDDDDNDSDMSSDLFELPVCNSAHIDSMRRSSMSTDSSGSSFMKLHV